MKMSCRYWLLVTVLMISNYANAQFYTIGKGYKVSLHVEEKTDSDEWHGANSDKAEKKIIAKDLFSYPLKNLNVGSKFGMRFHPIFHKNMLHNGVDLKAYYENVYSMMPGRVVRVGYDKRSGNYVIIQSADYTISYCHLSKAYVNINDFVSAGACIALSGNTGTSTGPHLHLTVRKGGQYQNPTVLFNLINKIKIDSELK